jgi:hypothetical protein
MYVIFFTAQDSAIKVTVSEGKLLILHFIRQTFFEKYRNTFDNEETQHVWSMSDCYMTTRHRTRRQ